MKHQREPTKTEITLGINESVVRIKDTQVNCFPIDPHRYTQLIPDKGGKTNRKYFKKIMLKIMSIHIQTHTQKTKVETGLMPFTIINSEHIRQRSTCKTQK